MTINTKFDIGDWVWTIHKNQVYEFVVKQIHFRKTKYGDDVSYWDSVEDKFANRFDEDCCFATKEELADYVLNKPYKHVPYA